MTGCKRARTQDLFHELSSAMPIHIVSRKVRQHAYLRVRIVALRGSRKWDRSEFFSYRCDPHGVGTLGKC